MKREIKREEIYHKNYARNEGDQAIIRFKDLPLDLLPDDIIHIVRDEGYYSENNSWDPFTRLEIYREREENDEEYEKRKKIWKGILDKSKEDRHRQYLKLKEEFEGK